MKNSSPAPLVSIEAERIPAERILQLARPTLAAVRQAFEDPAVVADFEAWKKARRLAGKA